MKLIDITGQRFGRLVVLRKGALRKNGGSNWICNCDCGNEAVVIGGNLRSGATRSCGCLSSEMAATMGANPEFIAKRSEKTTKHGHKRRSGKSVEYATWLAMKRRCQDKKCRDYPNWGGRGIRVCDRWNESFEAFLADMGPRPPDKHGIDRRRSNEDYEPGNCRWATATEQGSENKRSNVPVTVNGVTFQSIAAAARHFGVNVEKAWTRVSAGVPADIAVSTVGRLKRPRTRDSYLPKSMRQPAATAT